MATPCPDPRRRTLAATVLLTLLLAAPAVADPEPAAPAAAAFADFLFAGGDYYRAVTEYQRILFSAGDDDPQLQAYASLMVGRALFSGEEFHRAIAWLQPRLNLISGSPWRAEGRRLFFRSLLNARSQIGFEAAADSLGAPEAPFYRGFALGIGGRWDEAARAFADIPLDSPYHRAARINLEIARRTVDLPWKSPTTAGVLSIVPGLGYLYSGHKKTALTSLIMNAGFGVAAYQAFDSNQDALGAVLSLFSLSWYQGNITGSVAAARRYNRHLNDDAVYQLRD